MRSRTQTFLDAGQVGVPVDVVLGDQRTAQVSVVVQPGAIRLAEVIRVYADLTDTLVADLVGPSQVLAICQHRHRLMFLIRRIDPTASYSLIGRYLGGRDMATVHEAVAKIKSAFTHLPSENILLCRLETLIRERLAEEAVPPLPAPPWQLLAATQILRDENLTDAEARKVALGFLSELEGTHG